MTISNTTRKAGPFTGTGLQTVFPFTFKVFVASDLLAVQAVTSTGVETPQVLTANYTVVLNVDQNASPGGSLTMLVAPPVGATLTLTSQVLNTQFTDLINAGGFYPKVVNDALDRATIQIQQLAEKVARAIGFPLSDTSAAALPGAAGRAGKFLVFDPLGNPTVSTGTGADVGMRGDLAASGGSGSVGFLQAGTGATPRTVQNKERDIVHIDDFGGNINLAATALGVNGGMIFLGANSYAPPSVNFEYNNIAVIGQKRPSFKADGTGLEGGSIVKGPFVYLGNNLEFRNLGIDSGSAVCTALYAGVAQEGLICTVTYLGGKPQYAGLVVDNVVSIGKNATAAIHAFAAEGHTRAYINNVETLFGTHGQAYKLLDSQVNNIRSRGNSSEGVVIKSDATRQCKRTTFNGIKVGNYAADTLNGIDIQAQGSQEVSDIAINQAVCEGVNTGLKLTSSVGSLIRDLTFGNGQFNGNSVDGFSSSGPIKRIKFIGCTASTNSQFGFTEGASAANVSYTACNASNNSSGFVCFGSSTDLVSCDSMDNTSFGFYGKTGASVYKTGNRGTGNGVALYGADAGVIFLSRQTLQNAIAPTLLGAWVNFGSSNAASGYYLDDEGWVTLRGLVRSGTGMIFTLPAGYRPPLIVRFPVATLAGATQTFGEVYVSDVGDVVLAAGGNAYVSLDGIRFRAY